MFFPDNNKVFVELLNNPLFGTSFASVFWLPIEAIFLTRTGSTPGKWLFGIRVFDESGNKFPFMACLNRSITVWVQGLGLFIPLVTFFTIYAGYSRLNKTGTTLWDTSINSRVKYQDFGYLRGIFSGFIILLVLINMSLVKDLSSHKNQTSQKTQPNVDENFNQKGWEALAADKKDEAFQSFKKSAEQGNAIGEDVVGICFQEGSGVAKDEAEAVEWFKKSAEQGYDHGENELGYCYLYGVGITKDYEKAAMYFRKAAEQSYSGAENNLGVCYLNGWGVPKNLIEAKNWSQKAADQGNVESEFNLAMCFFNGWGVKKDMEQAKHWFKLAANQNYPKAKKVLEVFK